MGTMNEYTNITGACMRMESVEVSWCQSEFIQTHRAVAERTHGREAEEMLSRALKISRPGIVKRRSYWSLKQSVFVSLRCLSLTPQKLQLLYSHLQHNNDTIIKTQGQRQMHEGTTHEGRRSKTSLPRYVPLPLFLRFERVVQGLHVRGSWRSNINCNILTPLLWPSRCVFLVLLMLGSTPSGLPRAPSVGCGFPYHIWSLAVWNSTGNCFLDSNPTELNNNSTPTRSPTRSLKSNV